MFWYDCAGRQSRQSHQANRGYMHHIAFPKVCGKFVGGQEDVFLGIFLHTPTCHMPIVQMRRHAISRHATQQCLDTLDRQTEGHD